MYTFVVFVILFAFANITYGMTTDFPCYQGKGLCCCLCAGSWECSPKCGCPGTSPPPPPTTEYSPTQHKPNTLYYLLCIMFGFVLCIVLWCSAPLMCGWFYQVDRFRDRLYLKLCSRSLLYQRTYVQAESTECREYSALLRAWNTGRPTIVSYSVFRCATFMHESSMFWWPFPINVESLT